MTPNSWWDVINPFSYLGDAAGKVVADGWTAAMLGVWNAGLWVLRTGMGWVDAFLTPDLSIDGPGGLVYQTTFWVAGSLVVIMLMAQLGLAAFRRDGRALGQALIGIGQFMMVWVGWVTWCVAIVLAASGLTTGLLKALLGVDMWSAWDPWGGFSTEDIVDGTLATVLGMMGLVLWFTAITFIIIMLTRAGALIVMVATGPIAAAGLVAETGRTWFWKTVRWVHAAAATPVLIVMVIGLGVQLTAGVVTTAPNAGLPTEIGMALIGVILILIACFSPLALFKLLAFVDPSTSSGAAVRAGVQEQGGWKKMLRQRGGSESSGQASEGNDMGQAQGESSAESATSGRFSQANGGQGAGASTAGGASGGGAAGSGGASGGGAGAAGAAGGVAGGIVGGIAGGLAAIYGGMKTVGVKGASIGADVTNQSGVGHGSYYPDIGGGEQRRRNGSQRQQDQGESDARRRDPSDPSEETRGQNPATDPATAPTSPRQAAPTQDPGGSDGGGSGPGPGSGGVGGAGGPGGGGGAGGAAGVAGK